MFIIEKCYIDFKKRDKLEKHLGKYNMLKIKDWQISQKLVMKPNFIALETKHLPSFITFYFLKMFIF